MKTTIEINGKTYDARTGKVIATGAARHEPSSAPTRISQPPLQQGTVMDGISRNKRPVAHLSRSAPSAVLRAQATTAHHQQKSQTLHRKAVKKPLTPQSIEPVVHPPKLKPQIQTTTGASKVEHSATGRGMLLKRVPDARLSRAMNLKRSALVSKFNPISKQKAVLTTDLRVAEQPKQPSHARQPNQTVAQAPATNSVASHQQAVAQPNKKSKKEQFESRIQQANSHLLKPVKKERKKVFARLRRYPKVISAVAGVCALLVLGGFFAYQKIPQVGMKVAASKAGFEGRLPGSIPAGFAYKGPVETAENTIAITYASKVDDKLFVLNQKPTNWSSESLLTNFLSTDQFRYQIYKDKGLTVYVFNGSNATWVDKGIWFTVNGQASGLSSEQLLEIASST